MECCGPIRLHLSNCSFITHRHREKERENTECRFHNKVTKMLMYQCNVSQNVQYTRWEILIWSFHHTHTQLLWANPVSMATPEHIPLGGSYGGGTKYGGQRERLIDREKTSKIDHVAKQQQFEQGRWHADNTHTYLYTTVYISILHHTKSYGKQILLDYIHNLT